MVAKRNGWKVIDGIPLIIRRIFMIGIILALILFLGLGILAKFSMTDQPPSSDKAPWAIQTNTRIYYAKEFRLNGAVPEINGYWALEGKRYKFYDEIKTFNKSEWGLVTPVRRAR